MLQNLGLIFAVILATFGAPQFGAAQPDPQQIPLAHDHPIVSPDGEFHFAISPDGWVQKRDARSADLLARLRVGARSNNMTMSANGKWLAIANDVPNSLVILFTEDLSIGGIRIIELSDKTSSRIRAVHDNPSRESFILELRDLPQIWEVFYGANPPSVSLTHDWRVEGPVENKDPFPIRRFPIPERMQDFQFDETFEYITATSIDGQRRAVIDLVIGHKIKDLTGNPGEHR